jgi:hypothetical protein
MARFTFSGPRAIGVAVLAAVAMAWAAGTAWAGPGYQPASSGSPIPLDAEIPAGVAIDQSTQAIYVAEGSRGLLNLEAGEVEQLSSAGTPTASSPFGTGGQDLFVSVAVNPVTHGVYTYQIEASTPFGLKGSSEVNVFSSAGVAGASFSPANTLALSLASDSSGRLFLPSSPTSSVQIFGPTGTLEGSVSCGSCPGGAFVTPQSVAFDSAGDLYVVDIAAGGRVLKFKPSGGSYVYESTLQSGAGAVAVGVDGSSGDVFVGDLVGSKYHLVAYDSSGTEFDDFGAGLITHSQIEQISGQIAVNATTGKLYVSNPGGNDLLVFEPIASIPSPTASVIEPSPLGQTTASLRATVNPKGHVLTSCGFEYTNQADFEANGFTNAETASCPPLVGEKESTTISSPSVSGLAPATVYDYRIKIASYGGAAESGPRTFETLPPLPPVATTGAASALTKTTTTLGGSVNPKGGVISNCHFEWVSEAAFAVGGFAGASSKACTPTPSGNTATNVTAKATGLTAGTAYRFRVVATNNSGTGTATDASFATAAETCAENQALCPPSGGSSQPPSSSPPVVAPAPTPSPTPAKPLKCRKGFKKKKVRGKQKCVRIKKHRGKH